MPGENDNIIFGAEFDSGDITSGVNEVVKKLEEAKEAQKQLKDEIAATNKELKANETQLKQTQAALQKASDPKDIERLSNNVKILSDNQVILKNNLRAANTELIVVSKGVNLYNSEINKTIKNQSLVSNSLEKFTSISHIGSEALGLFRRRVVDAGFSLISGFAGGIVAQVLPAVIDLVKGLFDASGKLSEFEKDQKAINEIQEKSIPIFAAQVAKLDIYKGKLDDLTIPQNERIKLAKEYNKTAEEGNKIDIKQIDNIDLVNSAIDRQIAKIKERALARAFEITVTEKAEAVFKAQLKLQEQLPGLEINDKLLENIKKVGIGAFTPQQQEQLKQFIVGDVLGDRVAKTFIEAKEDFDRTIRVGLPLINVESLIPPIKNQDTTPVANVFQQKLNELKTKLAALTAQTFESVPNIQSKFATALREQFDAIDKLVNAKKPTLTNEQGGILKDLLTQINSIELTKSLDTFGEKREAALKRINDSLLNIEVQGETERIKNIQNQFERRKAEIESNEQKVVDAIIEANINAQKKINEEAVFATPDVTKQLNDTLTSATKEAIDQAHEATTQALSQLSFDVFEDTVKRANVVFDKLNLENDEKTAAQILNAKKLYSEGAITYEQYQKQITKALKDQKAERDKIRLIELNTELAAINKRLTTETDGDNKTKLESQARGLRSQIAAINTQVDKGEDPDKKRTENLKKYVAAVGSLLQTIVSFWQQVNATESAALDRSIALQEKRVENARSIADKGNAEYLEMEQKRLDELQRKREANAQKQLAINNALVLSQALLAAVSAIAQAAATSGPAAPFAAIAAGIAVVGAIAAAYSFVKSLQPPVATFFKGTEYVEANGHPTGKDTVPARLTIGERVTTAKDNKDYWETLSAIHNHLIPPEVLNSFVNNYPNVDIPVIDFSRLNEATNGKVGYDNSELRDRLDKLNDTMSDVVDAVKGIGIGVNMDEDGLSVAISRSAHRRRLRKNS